MRMQDFQMHSHSANEHAAFPDITKTASYQVRHNADKHYLLIDFTLISIIHDVRSFIVMHTKKRNVNIVLNFMFLYKNTQSVFVFL